MVFFFKLTALLRRSDLNWPFFFISRRLLYELCVFHIIILWFIWWNLCKWICAPIISISNRRSGNLICIPFAPPSHSLCTSLCQTKPSPLQPPQPPHHPPGALRLKRSGVVTIPYRAIELSFYTVEITLILKQVNLCNKLLDVE